LGHKCFSLVNLFEWSVYKSDENLAFKETDSVVMTGGLLLTLIVYMQHKRTGLNVVCAVC